MSVIFERTYSTSVNEQAMVYLIQDLLVNILGDSKKFGNITFSNVSRSSCYLRITFRSDSGWTYTNTNAANLCRVVSSTSSKCTVRTKYIKTDNAFIILNPTNTNSLALFKLQNSNTTMMHSANSSIVQQGGFVLASTNRTSVISTGDFANITPVITTVNGVDISSDDDKDTMICVPFIFPIAPRYGIDESEKINRLYIYSLPLTNNTTVLGNALEFTFNKINSNMTYRGIKIPYNNDSNNFQLTYLY